MCRYSDYLLTCRSMYLDSSQIDRLFVLKVIVIVEEKSSGRWPSGSTAQPLIHSSSQPRQVRHRPHATATAHVTDPPPPSSPPAQPRDRPTTINETKMNVTAARTVLTSATRLVSGTTATASRAFSSTTAASASDKTWKIYLSGEIHSDWREVIAKGVAEKNLPVSLSSPNTSHEDSDDCGAIILGMEEERRNWDKLGANMNNLRTKTLIKDADIVVIRFGPKYRQCKYSFDLSSHFISRR